MRKAVILIILTLFIVAPLNVALAYTTNYRYEGKAFDEEAGLYNFDIRQYNPNIGQFIQADTYLEELLLKGAGSNDPELQRLLMNPQLLNQRSFKKNNPINYTDPTGKTPIPVIIPIALFALSDLLLHDIKVAQAPTLNSTPQVIENKDVADFIPVIQDMPEEARLATGLIIGGMTSRAKTGIKLVDRLVKKMVGRFFGRIFQKKVDKAVVESLNINNLPNVLEKSLKPIYDPALAGTKEVLKNGAWQVEVIYREALGADQSLSRIVKYRNLEENLTKVYHEVIDTAGQIIHRDLK